MQQRNNSDRRDNDRRLQSSPVKAERRMIERRSGADRRTMLSSSPS